MQSKIKKRLIVSTLVFRLHEFAKMSQQTSMRILGDFCIFFLVQRNLFLRSEAVNVKQIVYKLCLDLKKKKSQTALMEQGSQRGLAHRSCSSRDTFSLQRFWFLLAQMSFLSSGTVFLDFSKKYWMFVTLLYLRRAACFSHWYNMPLPIALQHSVREHTGLDNLYRAAAFGYLALLLAIYYWDHRLL